MALFHWHKGNKIGYHFYLPIAPYHLFSFDCYFARINMFWPVWVSISFGRLEKKGFQIAGGIKFDPTETLKRGENDYLFSLEFRRIKLGRNCRVNSQASF